MFSRHFSSRELNRGRRTTTVGTRGCWVRIQGPVCNLLLIYIYLPPIGSKAEVVTRVGDRLRGLKQELLTSFEHEHDLEYLQVFRRR